MLPSREKVSLPFLPERIAFTPDVQHIAVVPHIRLQIGTISLSRYVNELPDTYTRN